MRSRAVVARPFIRCLRNKSTMKRVSIIFSIAFSVISSIASVSAASSSFVEHADGITDTSTTMRRLEDGGGLEFEDLSETPMHEVILTSLKVYGSVFAVLFVIFLLGRRYYPKAFLVLRDSEEDATELSRKSFGPLSWIWKVFGIGDEEIFEECGMDAVSIYCVVAVSCNPGCCPFTILTLNKFLRYPISTITRSSSFALSALECVLPP